METARYRLYQKYLSSGTWMTIRDRKLKAVGHRCEFRPPLDWDHNLGTIYGKRCTKTRGLEVHHLTYDSLGQEKDEDLEVLCHKHHLVRHVEMFPCELCGDLIEPWETDALALVERAYEWIDPRPHKMTLDHVIDHRWQGRMCSYCEHMWSKDD